MLNWDYKLGKNWKPATHKEWEWFLVRKINYDDLEGIDRKTLLKYFENIKSKLDPGKRVLLEYYFHTNL